MINFNAPMDESSSQQSSEYDNEHDDVDHDQLY